LTFDLNCFELNFDLVEIAKKMNMKNILGQYLPNILKIGKVTFLVYT